MKSNAPQNPPPRVEFRLPRRLKAYHDALCDWLDAIQPVAGLGVSISQQPHGRVISAAGGAGGASGGSRVVSFQVTDASTESTKKVRIRLGTVKSDGSLWIPTGMFLGDTPPLIMDVVGTDGVVCLKMTVDGNGDTTAAEIYIGASQPSDGTTNGYWLLGTYATDGDLFSVTSTNAEDQAHIFCGIEHHFAKG